MRPLSLTLEGFTCFKQRQTISFDGLELFAIWGPTGAGKTSLLDAMVFALFGRVPRLDERRNRDVISLTRDKAVVIFDFGSGTQKYRVVRTAKRKGAPEAKLEDGDGNLLAEGVRGVEAEILRCLGLSYDAFVQSVMLPQGEFARFLKSQPGQRRVILRDLLRLEVYERMRATAEQRRRDLDARLSGLGQVLGEYADATPEALEALERQLVAAREDQKIKQDQFAALTAYRQELAALRKKTEELEQLRRNIAELDGQEPAMRAARLRIDASERARAAMPQILRAEDAQAAAGQAQDAARRAKAAAENELGQHSRSQRLAEAAAEEATQLGPLRDRIRALDGIRGVLEPKLTALRRLKSAKDGLDAAESRVRAADVELSGLRKDLRDHKREAEKAEERLARVAYDKELDALAQEVARDAMQLAEERKQALAADVGADRAEADASKARAELVKKARMLEQARRKHREGSDALEEAEQARRAAHELHAAVVLRRTLRRGEPCPVCAHEVRTIPKAIPTPGLDAVTERYNQAKRAEAEASAGDKEVTAEHAGLEATASELAKAAALAKGTAQEATGRVARLQGELAKKAGGKFDGDSGATIEERVLSGVKRLAKVRDEYYEESARLRELERKRDVVGKAIEGRETVVEQLREAAGLAGRHVTQILAELEELDAKIRAVTTHPDPAAESAELANQVDEIEGRLEIARAAFAEAQAKLATAQAVAADAAEKAAGTAEEAAALVREAEAAVNAAGFGSLTAAKDAVAEPGEFARLRKSVEDYHVDRETTGRRISVLERELGGREVSEPALNAAGTELEAASRERDAAVGEVATLNDQIQRTRDRLERRKRFGAEQERCKAEHTVYRQLAEELRTDRFQEFVLEEAFHDLARGASERLKELSGRYALRYEDGDILVVDHDNADETRSADTLSGGETFLVSLSLALELSEQIQQAAGAVLLESLFIDEGFGTLDQETLDSATSAIECLRGGGRMVGIITHIRDLADRLPCRIEVDWRSEGSRVSANHS